jgi:hypothetical protein
VFNCLKFALLTSSILAYSMGIYAFLAVMMFDIHHISTYVPSLYFDISAINVALLNYQNGTVLVFQHLSRKQQFNDRLGRFGLCYVNLL